MTRQKTNSLLPVHGLRLAVLAAPLAIVTTLAVGCAPDGGDAFSPRNDGPDTPVPASQEDASSRVRGSVDSSAASDVRAVSYDEEGRYLLLGEGSVAADGTFEIDVVPDTEDVVIDALDAEGRILASVIVERTPSEDEELDAGELNDETSVEAEVLLALRADAEASDSADSEDVTSRVTVDLAASAMAASDRAEVVEDLALAIDIAAEAEARAWAEAEGETRMDGEAQAEVSIQAEIDAQVEAAFRSTLEATMDDAETRTQAFVESARVEAESTADAMITLSDEAEGEARTSLQLAAEALIEDMEEAGSEEEVDAAFALFADAVVASTLGVDGTGSSEGSAERGLLADLEAAIELDLEVLLDGLFDELEEAGSDFAAEVSAAVQASLDASADASSEAREEAADAAVDAHAELEASVETAVSGLFDEIRAGSEAMSEAEAEAQASLMIEILVHGEGHAFLD